MSAVGAELTSPDALEALPVGARIEIRGFPFVKEERGAWRLLIRWHPTLGTPTVATGDQLLDRGPVRVTSLPWNPA